MIARRCCSFSPPMSTARTITRPAGAACNPAAMPATGRRRHRIVHARNPGHIGFHPGRSET